LKDRGIGVYFEKENLNTLSLQSEMLLTVYAAFAQEESHSVSENMKRGIRQRFQIGIPKAIFGWYATGKSLQKIADKLEAEGVKTLRGKERFGSNTILLMLRNEVYKGDRLLQKKPHYNYMLHKPECLQKVCSLTSGILLLC
jgi:DNA invertase Pin-like site-specific DNA recombinase